MNAVNAVQLFILVWTFYAVSQADDDFIVSCDNVTGSVGNEGTFTCSVSLQRTDCCIQIYKFQYPNRYNDSAICKKEFPVNLCEQRNSFTCRYTPSTAMTEQFRFFLQTTCGVNITEFTVNIPVPTTPETVTEAPSMKVPTTSETVTEAPSMKDTAEDPRSTYTVTAVVVGFFILLLIIVIMTVIRNKKPNINTSCRFQKRMFLGLRHNKDNIDHPEDVISAAV